MPQKGAGPLSKCWGLKLVPPEMQRDAAYWRKACVARQGQEEVQLSPWMGRASLHSHASVSLWLSSLEVSLWLTMEK